MGRAKWSLRSFLTLGVEHLITRTGKWHLSMASVLLEKFSGSKAIPLKPLNLNLVPTLLFIFVAGLEKGYWGSDGTRLPNTAQNKLEFIDLILLEVASSSFCYTFLPPFLARCCHNCISTSTVQQSNSDDVQSNVGSAWQHKLLFYVLDSKNGTQPEEDSKRRLFVWRSSYWMVSPFYQLEAAPEAAYAGIACCVSTWSSWGLSNPALQSVTSLSMPLQTSNLEMTYSILPSLLESSKLGTWYIWVVGARVIFVFVCWYFNASI